LSTEPPRWQPPSGEPSAQPPTGQPSSGRQPGPPGQPGQPGQSQSAYPQQTLLPQEVKRGRSRKPLVIGLVVALLIAAGGIVAWQLLKDNGEETRAAYCAALKKLTNNGDITAALSGAGTDTLSQLGKVQSLAPAAVKGDWDTLQSLSQSAQSGNVDASVAIKAFSALKSIADDADSKCGIPMNVPGLG
jgi:hypothetical protein